MDAPQTVTPTPPADSSPAPVSAQSYLDRMDAAERTQWELSGEFPERLTKADATATSEKPDASADPSPATPVEQADATAAPSAEKPQQKPDKRAASNRNQQLDTEITDLREKLKIRAALREELAAIDRPKQDAAADSSTAKPTTAEWERYVAMPEAPKIAEFESIDAHAAAMALFITDQRWKEHESRQRQTASEQQRRTDFESMTSAAAERIRKATAADPDFRSKVNDHLLDIPPVSALPPNQKPTPHNVLAEEILRSDVTDKLLLHFSTEQGQQDWQRLCASRSHPEFLRAFGRLEAGLSGAASAAPRPKHVSSAPEPARTLGNRSTDGGDPIARAVKDGDFARFERLANERELAAR